MDGGEPRASQSHCVLCGRHADSNSWPQAIIFTAARSAWTLGVFHSSGVLTRMLPQDSLGLSTAPCDPADVASAALTDNRPPSDGLLALTVFAVQGAAWAEEHRCGS